MFSSAAGERVRFGQGSCRRYEFREARERQFSSIRIDALPKARLDEVVDNAATENRIVKLIGQRERVPDVKTKRHSAGWLIVWRRR
jgi:hypothetical protein